MNAREGGFSLLEIVVAMTLLAFVVAGLAQLNFALARRVYGLAGGAARDGVIAQQLNELAALPFDSLKGKAGSVTVNKPPIPYTRSIRVDSLSPKLERVTIVITPLNAVFKPDTLVLDRSKPGKNPFNKP